MIYDQKLPLLVTDLILPVRIHRYDPRVETAASMNLWTSNPPGRLHLTLFRYLLTSIGKVYRFDEPDLHKLGDIEDA
jgi:hypothetical protein